MYEVTVDSLEQVAGGHQNHLDDKGVYHLVCTKCGKDIKTWKPQKGSCYACGPQICENCQKIGKNDTTNGTTPTA